MSKNTPFNPNPAPISNEQIRADFKNLSPDTPDLFTRPEAEDKNLDFDSDFDLQKAMAGPGCPFPDDSEPETSYLPKGWPDPIKAMRVWQWVMFITLSMFLARALYIMYIMNAR
ncbi:hypothetical protein GALL_439710 [mine drainage metagenome]|uniref:Uncharacterized protein n=1 Tax=mine drainage metagenome TaxID=410659 RepID=A0A1J5QA54_9ZZZZ